jgi:hypothetical protein
MKKLLIPNGGMPLEGDDFNWINAGVVEAFKAIFFEYGQAYSGNFVISGCVATFAAGFASVTEGYVMLDWEICYCPAQTVGVASLAVSSLKLVSSFDAAGTEVFADSVSRETYENRRAIISDGLNSGVEIPLDTTGRFYAVENVNAFDNGWGAASGFVPKYHKKGNVIHITGAITGGETNLLAFTVPLAYRPSETRRLAISRGSISIPSSGQVIIGTTDSGGSQVTVSGDLNLDVSYVL